MQIGAMRPHPADDVAFREDTDDLTVVILDQQCADLVFGQRDRRLGDLLSRLDFIDLPGLAME